MTMLNTTATIIRIQDLLERWRSMGARRLRNGTELLAAIPDGDQQAWMHVVFAGESEEDLDMLEGELGKQLPKRLRTFYRGCGGMTLFQGAFRLHGIRRPGFCEGEGSLQPESLVELNHSLDMAGRLPERAVAFAANGWDGSVYVLGMGHTDEQVVRCDPQTGEITERHRDVFSCVEARLYRLDEMSM